MKRFFLMGAAGLIISCKAFSQCPAPGVKILSAACEDPRNLQVVSVSCSELKVKWLGNRGQTYIVKAVGTDPFTGNSFEEKTSNSTCDNLGSCQATLAIKQGGTVSWTVQAVCSAEGAVVYSSEVEGGTAVLPVCAKLADSSASQSVHVYPNPANAYLNVQYDGGIAGTTEFRIYDITGKKQYSRQDGTAAKTSNRYRLDVRKLPPGVYLLETANGNEIYQTKFVVGRN